MKRIYRGIIVISAAFILVLTSAILSFAGGDIASGNYYGVDWRVTSDYKLIIGKEGETQTMIGSSGPWERRREKITSVEFRGKVISSDNLEFMFDGYKKLTYADFTGFDTSNATSMYCMFIKCKSLKKLDIAGFDTSNVTNMQDMFSGCTNLKKIDVSGFDTGKVTNMEAMFAGCTNLKKIDVSGFDTSKVTDIKFMFDGCKSLASPDISGFNMANVTSMEQMFMNCRSIRKMDLSNLNTHKVKSMKNLFAECGNLVDVDMSGLDTGNVRDMNGMFKNCVRLRNVNLKGIKTDKAKDLDDMFYGCACINELDLRSFVINKNTLASCMLPNEVCKIRTPAHLKVVVGINNSYGMLDSKGKKYEILPKNQKKSIALYTPKPISITKVVKGSGSLTVKWKKPKQKFMGKKVDGYEVRYSTDEFFKTYKTKRVKGYNNTSVKLKKLKHGKKYYIRIRTYTMIGTYPYYSTWSVDKIRKVS